jgi:type IV pilus biogenesis protein CpaD/CtpE
MTLAKTMTLVLLLASLAGCASQIQSSNTPGTTTEKQDEETRQKSTMPDFTYRPGA